MDDGPLEPGGTSGAADPYSDWYALVDGQTLGPLQWGSVVDLVHRRGPNDFLVWHSTLPAWTPAGSLVPGSRCRRTSWVLPVLIPLATLVVAGAVLGALWGAGVFGGNEEGPPLVQVEVVAPTDLDVAYETTLLSVTPEEGGSVSVEGMELIVPPGAVESETEIEVRTLTEPFQVKTGSSPAPSGIEGDLSAACIAGPVFDLGPDGLSFDEPVTLTLPYDQAAIPAGFPEDEVAFAYWNGETWVAHPGLVDAGRNTVTVQLSEFHGLIETTVTGVVIVSGIIIATGLYIYHKWTETDPIIDGTASQWVTPDDGTVKKQAERAVLINPADPNDQIPLDDPLLVDWVENATANHLRPTLGYRNDDGTVKKAVFNEGAGSNWQKPAHYFTEGTTEAGPLSGDCTDAANATVSVLRTTGYLAKGTFGYVVVQASDAPGETKLPHVWTEAVIGGSPYLFDEMGSLWPLDAETLQTLHLERAPADDGRNAMWDEKEQTKYVERWWEKEETTSTVTAGTGATTVTTLAGEAEPGQIPVEPGWEVGSVTEAMDPSDPSDIRVYVTSTKDSSIGDRKSVAITVFEYRYLDGVLRQEPSARVFFTDVSLTATNTPDPLADGLARAAEATLAYIAEMGLAAIVR